MTFEDRQLQELAQTQYPLTRQPDFDAFWAEAKARVEAHDGQMRLEEIAAGGEWSHRVYDATLPALDGTPLKAWLYLPRNATEAQPAAGMVHLHGGGGSRGGAPMLPATASMTGCALLVTEFRMQGGETGSATPMKGWGKSFSTLNLHCADHRDYYFYHAFTDQLLWLRRFLELPQVDAARCGIYGASQGGGTAMILAALEPRLKLILPAVPSYCCWERRIFTRTACASDIADYLIRFPERADAVRLRMSYFDAMNFADRIQCPVHAQINLRDEMAPADCAFSAYNRIAAPKTLKVNPFGFHRDVDYWLWQREIAAFVQAR